MTGFAFIITTAGLDALVDAQNGLTEAIEVVEIGVSDSLVEIAPTLTALPGEIKRLDALSGQAASETIIHMTAIDSTSDAYDVRSVALYLSDGTLFAAYSRAEGPVFSKVDIASFLFSIDIAFGEAVADAIVFGDATFLYPPATEETKGVAELATQTEVDDEVDDQRIVTPLKLATRLSALLAPILQSIADEIAARTAADTSEAAARSAADIALQNSINGEVTARADADTALQNSINGEATARSDADSALETLLSALVARTITGSGLVTGGGNLGANRVLQVLAASAADVIAGTAANRAITPAALGPIVKALGLNGYVSIPTADPTRLALLQWGRFTAAGDGLTAVTFPLAFSAPAFSVVADGTNQSDTGVSSNPPRVRSSTITATGFSVFSAINTAESCTFIAIGEVNNA